MAVNTQHSSMANCTAGLRLW